MSQLFPDVRVGQPQLSGSLAVFPLFSEGSLFTDRAVDYILAHEAMARGTVAVTEVSDAGSIPDLLVENNGDVPCLILEGTELRGSKQTRMLNTTTLVGGKSQIRIPVSCVEHGRWRRDSQQSSSGSHCPPTLRGLLKGSAHACRRGLGSHQIGMWSAIRRKHRALGVTSATEDLSAALESHREKLERLKTQFPYPANANGIAVAIGGRITAIDIVDKPVTLEKVWSRLQEGVLLDLLEVPEATSQATGAEVLAELYRLRALPWHQVESVGLGEQHRAHDDGVLANALLHEGVTIHASASLRFPQ
ncbi:MAG: ARPP-1 family domain-containing protein [Thermoguttaceae bacterium]